MLQSDAEAVFIHIFLTYKITSEFRRSPYFPWRPDTVVMGTDQRHAGAVRPHGFDSRAHTRTPTVEGRWIYQRDAPIQETLVSHGPSLLLPREPGLVLIGASVIDLVINRFQPAPWGRSPVNTCCVFSCCSLRCPGRRMQRKMPGNQTTQVNSF